MTYTEILYEVDKEHGFSTITFNRPQYLNAISPKLEEEFHAALDEADHDKSVRAIIITGAGRAFCSGYDVGTPERSAEQIPGAGQSPMDPTGKSISEFIAHWHIGDAQSIDKLLHLWKLSKPVIAAVNGWAMGGGFWYQLASDLTIASEDAVFAQPEVRHVSNTSFLFVALCGWKVANRFALTGDHLDANEALRIGLVNEIVERDKLMDRAREIATRIALVPEPSVRINKQIAMMGVAIVINGALMLNGSLSALVHSSYGTERERLAAAREEGGLRGFLEARDGPFQPEPFGPRSKQPASEQQRA